MPAEGHGVSLQHWKSQSRDSQETESWDGKGLSARVSTWERGNWATEGGGGALGTEWVQGRAVGVVLGMLGGMSHTAPLWSGVERASGRHGVGPIQQGRGHSKEAITAPRDLQLSMIVQLQPSGQL